MCEIFELHISCYFHAHLQLHSSLVDCAREQFKTSKDAASLVDYNEKTFLVSGFFVGDIISGIVFSPFWLRLPDPGPKLLDQGW